ncbi:S-(hydroxymethyl)glutathione dehydrogenase/alcohol dehydrogenase [Kaistia hirudinis]|uniref:S-(Hydroxymethyl)glutathione dehydrogenase/alcohol dehydrogenase n=1 Tax=Kaistia hirudinis TaxID=1293440 RepID=A0A840AHJ9_9HYPH|nr:zinc-binding dehydrogenase [Kaistia hirudinis]MBB3929819.1 S-(hydroxymethyl)glutathione dehydrogenase/alcohol dehydrogenase [Kaistia hirudinis]
MIAHEDQPALVLHALGETPRIERVSISPPGRGEVLVRIMASGVCHTDIGYVQYARTTPVVLGHEGAGVVAALGEGVSHVAIGDHVAINWQAKCGVCRNCVSGRRQFCEGVLGTSEPRVHLDGKPLAVMLNAGTFCPYAVVPASGAVPIRKDMPFAVAALLGCAVATGVGAAMFSAKVQAGDDVVIIGCGGVGLNTLQGARLANARVIVAVDRDPEKLALAARLGATHVVDSAKEPVFDAVMQATDGRGADHVFELVGRTDLMVEGLGLLARGGRLTLVGAAGRQDEMTFKPRGFMSKQQTICGCIYGDVQPERDLPLLADWYADGRLELDALHTDTIELKDLPAMFEPGYRPHGIRTVVSLEGLA